MAISKLGIYNNALMLIGSSRLDALTDDVDHRYALDDAYDQGAEDFCLKLIRPKFATSTTSVTGSATTGGVSLAFTHTLPADFVTIKEVYADAELDQRVNRKIVQGSTLLCDYETIYLRYVHNTITEADDYTADFADVLSAYLASKVVRKFSPDEVENVNSAFESMVEASLALEKQLEDDLRPSAEGSTLSSALRVIYNDALLILGKPKIPNGNDDHPNRVDLDTAFDAGAAEGVLEDIEWKFGTIVTKIDYDTNVEPEFGYEYAFDKPADLLRIAGVFQDEYCQVPLKFDYSDEGDYFFSNLQTIYLKYVDSDFVTSYASWPTYFKRLVAARLAMDAAPVIDRTMIDHAEHVYTKRKNSAQSNDAIQSPPQRIAQGSWIRSRHTRSTNHGRDWN